MCLLLLASLSARAETVVRADWEQARAMLTQGEFRPRIRVELKPSKWVKGKFIEATGAGLPPRAGIILIAECLQR